MTHKQLRQLLIAEGACDAAREWVDENKLSLTKAWKKCRRPSWMRWLVEALMPDDMAESARQTSNKIWLKNVGTDRFIESDDCWRRAVPAQRINLYAMRRYHKLKKQGRL